VAGASDRATVEAGEADAWGAGMDVEGEGASASG
jgi:hypothetical protein